MKRQRGFICLLAVLLLSALLFTACGKKEVSPNVGEWTSTKYVLEDMELSVADVGVSRINFLEDGTLEADFAGEKATGKWEEPEEGGIVIDDGDDELDGVFEGSALVFDVQGLKIYFEKGAYVPDTTDDAAADTTPAADTAPEGAAEGGNPDAGGDTADESGGEEEYDESEESQEE